jgi:ABC-type transport system involved in multi-copper enzyme maturation permease subunit
VSAATVAAGRRGAAAAGGGFARVLRAEWTKFATIRGWVVSLVIAAVVMVGLALAGHSTCGGQASPGAPVVLGEGCAAPIGPGGEAVEDGFYFVRQPLAGDGSITARLTSLASPAGLGPASRAGLQPWAKAGVIIKASTRPGSAYAAVLLTAGHGVRMQYDYTGDIAGRPDGASPRWLRLTREGDRLTGYESADGVRWTRVGAVDLAGLPGTVQVGLFAAAPAGSSVTSSSITGSSQTGASGLAAARFDHVSVAGGRPGLGWAGGAVGGPQPGGGYRQSGGAITVTGSGDIAPDVPAAGGNGTPVETALVGTFGGLILVIVVAAMFMAAEYRRGLIRVTLTASPARGQVLAAKAIVIGLVTFAAGLVGAAASIPLGTALLRSGGNFILPVSPLTEVRLVAGTAALLAVAAVLTLALAAILRSGAGAVTAVVVGMVLPYFFGAVLAVLTAGPADWLLRVTPAAAFSVQQTLIPYPQVSAAYTPRNGYYPLPPWAGLAVLCGYAAAALALAVVLLRRRDA